MALVSSFDAIVFDYGGVLVSHQTEADQARFAAIARAPQEAFTEAYWACRPDYDKGLITAAEYWAEIAQKAGATLTESAVEQLTEADTESWMKFDDLMWAWVDELHKTRKRIAVLSNMPLDLGEALKSRTTRLQPFDQVTLSYETGTAKPEPTIYEHCLEGLDTAPERTLFLDDRIENVHGAELLGIRAMQFLDRDHILLQLRG